MGNRAARKLDPYRVALAQRTARAKHELAMKMVAERVKVDAEFAADVLKIAGETLRPEIRKDAEETIEREDAAIKARLEQPSTIEPCGCNQCVEEPSVVQSDGGGEVLKHPTELPDHPKDGGQ